MSEGICRVRVDGSRQGDSHDQQSESTRAEGRVTAVTTPDEQSEVSRGPMRGSVVVYQHRRDDDQDRFRIAVVVGPVVPEPMTGDLWVGVRLSQHPTAGAAVDLVAVASIVDTSPPDEEPTR